MLNRTSYCFQRYISNYFTDGQLMLSLKLPPLLLLLPPSSCSACEILTELKLWSSDNDCQRVYQLLIAIKAKREGGSGGGAVEDSCSPSCLTAPPSQSRAPAKLFESKSFPAPFRLRRSTNVSRSGLWRAGGALACESWITQKIQSLERTLNMCLWALKGNIRRLFHRNLTHL